MGFPTRKPNRLHGYNYSSNGYYFITICTKERQCILSNIVGGGAFDAPQSQLTDVGLIVKRYILSSNNIENIVEENYVIMPNHIHLLVCVEGADGTSRAPSPTNHTIPHMVSTLKRLVNQTVGRDVFQRSYHDHIIRDQDDYNAISDYITHNTQKWNEDCFYMD